MYQSDAASKILNQHTIYPKKYWLPDPVLTTLPGLIAPDTIGLVVIRSFSEKLGDPVIKPVTDPSLFCFHLFMVGTPRGAFLTGDAVAVAVLTVGDLIGIGSSSSPDHRPKSEIVALGFACSKVS